jgi:hypothetical protein
MGQIGVSCPIEWPNACADNGLKAAFRRGTAA